MGVRDVGWSAGAAIVGAWMNHVDRREMRRRRNLHQAVGVPDPRVTEEDAEDIDAELLADLEGR